MSEERLANPTPIGLMGLAVGCAALAPAELGLTSVTDPMIWVWMLLTAGALQIYAGLVDIINRNVLGATAFTLYGTLWLISAWQLGQGTTLGSSDVAVKGHVYLVYLLFTLYMTIGFATVSRILTAVFVAFVVIFVAEIAAVWVSGLGAFAARLAGALHAGAGLLCIWAAAGSVINPLLGRNLFGQGAPLLVSHGPAPEADDFESLLRHQGLRRRILTAMYGYWEAHAWDFVSTQTICEALRLPPPALAPDFWYLFQRGWVDVDQERMRAQPSEAKWVRITAAGIDHYRELQMGKFKF
jgi:succinate-acetate transporter protein